ncbi:MAG TPA: hypothetical protein VMV90_11155 [Rectinemataceae bacterium]|nr:hypothetical protein [Rectinemataceae bacterium]
MRMQERKSCIDLPVKLVLTEEGTTFFIRNGKNLKKFKLADNVEEYGIILDNFTPASLQRMMLVDYISKVEISKSEFMSSRQEIMDLSKLVVYSMLYRQYDSYIFARVLASDVIKKWNRLNPANIIDDKTRINDAFLQSVLKEKEKDLYDIKQQILAPMYAYISKNSALLPEEKNIQLLLSEKFLNNLRPFTWFIVAKFKGSEGYEQLVKDFRTSLAEYMEKSKIAEYISLMIMELAMNAENSNLKREAKAIFKGAVDMNAVLFDPNIRRQVLDSLERKGELVYLSWKIGSRGVSVGTQGRLQITLYNKESEYQSVKEIFDEHKNADLKKKSLMDFYKQLPDGEANTELGLYYLSYLSEACEKVNVKFESLVNQMPGSDLTIITLALYL